MAEAVADRPRAVTVDLFKGKVLQDTSGNEQVVDEALAQAICYDLIINGYVDRKGTLTDKFFEDKANNQVKIAEEAADCAGSVLEILDSVYNDRAMKPENARSNNVELQVDQNKLAMPEFKALWSKINSKSVYVVDFNTQELIQKSIQSLDTVTSVFLKSTSRWKVDLWRKSNLRTLCWKGLLSLRKNLRCIHRTNKFGPTAPSSTTW